MTNLEAEAQQLLDHAISERTRQTYKTAINAFQTFRASFGLGQALPATSHDIYLFIAHLSVLGYSPASVGTYLSGVAYEHKIKGMEDPTSGFIIKKMLEGLKRRKGIHKDARRPITLDILKKVCTALPHITSSTYEAQLFKAAFTLAFHGFLRVGEFAANSVTSVQRSVLTCDDIRLNRVARGIEVNFRVSKNNQHGEQQAIHIAAAQDLSICPFQALAIYLGSREHVPGPLFCHFDHSPLTRFQVTKTLQAALEFCQISTKNFKSHSFRIGAATTAASQGYSDEQIMQMGRWKSACFTKYIRIPTITAFNGGH